MFQIFVIICKMFFEISLRVWEYFVDWIVFFVLCWFKGFDQILKLMLGMLWEWQYWLLYLVSVVWVGLWQFVDFDVLLDECVDVLDVLVKFEFYVMQLLIVDVFIIGMGKLFIVIILGLYDLVIYDEMWFVMGYEFGYVLFGYVVYCMMMMYLLWLVWLFGVLLVGGWVLCVIVVVLLEWQCKLELFGDCVGLLCVQDLDIVFRVEMKFVGGCWLDKLDLEVFLVQVWEYEIFGDMCDGVFKLFNLELQIYLFLVLWVVVLIYWVDIGGYVKVIVGEYLCWVDDGNVKFVDDFGVVVWYYWDGFDQFNDLLIKGICDGFGGIVEGVGWVVLNVVDLLGCKIIEWWQFLK